MGSPFDPGEAFPFALLVKLDDIAAVFAGYAIGECRDLISLYMTLTEGPIDRCFVGQWA